MRRTAVEAEEPGSISEDRAIELAAESIRRDHGLALRRVQTVLRRLADMRWTDGSFPSTSPLSEAITRIGPDRALHLFENNDLGKLHDQVDATESLAESVLPIHPLDKLAEMVADFIQHLERNRQSLVATGHPQTSFSRSPFLDWYLGRLYYVKHPVTVQAGRTPRAQKEAEAAGEAERDASGDVLYHYTWGTEAPMPALMFSEDDRTQLLLVPQYVQTEDSIFTFDDRRVLPCSYEQAGLLLGLDQPDANRIEAIRPRVLAAALQILDRSLLALRKGKDEELWDDCVGLLAGCFTGEDVEFLLKSGSLLAAYHAGLVDAPTWDKLGEVLHNGTLQDVFLLALHCQFELSLGVLDRVARELAPFCPASGWAALSYYDIAVHPERARADDALRGFCARRTSMHQLRDQLMSRLQRRFRTEFREELLPDVFVKREHTPHFVRYIHGHAAAASLFLEKTGTLPISPPPTVAVTPPPPPDLNVFRRDGDQWTVSFEGSPPIRLNHTLGVRYIAHLLRHPHKEFTLLELVLAVEASGAIGAPADERETVEWPQDDDPAESDASTETDSDDEELALLWQEVANARAELKAAERGHDTDRIAAARQDLDRLRKIRNIISHPAGTQGPSARPRSRPKRLDEALERQRTRVRNNLRPVRLKIAQYLPSLDTHLKSSLHTGTKSWYKPERPVQWHLGD
jgi:hypothetical protein